MSVRAMMRKSGSRRPSTAARMRWRAVPSSTTSFAVQVPAALRVHLVFEVHAETPASSRICTVRATFIGSPNPVSASIRVGRSVTRAIWLRGARPR
jgi:hypothetical protein